MSWKDLGRTGARSASRLVFRPAVDGLEDRRLLTTLPTGFVETPVATGLSRPTTFEFAPDGRIFIAQQGGQIRVVKNGQLLATPFLSLNVDSNGERGLLGLAFDPQFATNHFVYAYYTVPGSPAHNRVSRFTANGDVVAPGSEVPILDLNALSAATNHNGGAIHFGADGKLYIGVGENANGANAQSLDNLLGKVLRINADGTIPTDNPFYNTATGQNRAIWALGLRNPFSFAVQPGTGTIFINDVGENTWEEIDDGIAGSNYGWPATEGPTTDPRFRAPIFAYPHGPNNVNGSAITDGVFYDPATTQFPTSAVGDYFFTDLTGGWIHQLDPRTGVLTGFATGLPPLMVALGVDPGGSLYYLAIGSGASTGVLAKIQSTATPPPTGQAPAVTRDPTSVSAPLGGSATFSVAASGTAPLTYQWQRNGANIPGATGASYTIATVSAGDLGASYRAVVINAFGSAVSQPAVLTADSPYARHLFTAIFGRTPDPTALSTLSLALAQGVTPQQLAAALLASPERHAQQVVAAYQTSLDRIPTAAEFTAGVNLLNAGTSREVFLASLISSQEYAARHGGTPRSLVQSIYQELLGRSPNRLELIQGTRSVSRGATNALVTQLLAGAEARTRLLTGWYGNYLGRRPTATELRTTLVQFRRGLSSDQAEAAILSGPEFIARS
ncbi:Glucose/arabinose dehydrogenase, beta-propeller fold [Singulisphaera sp. GP187]|uniref:PQQ-dependent sugar dehydrogenase n=1 Tax=Singulisphaera sp. GP187 TaxID=1882752 RepID=UPI00092AA498|nr:PQQ-dependent sugar dehydrogenase [Singulisphaera sp. GP187]SIO66710.1 Glucose/arabinose dehydrogenase, beta-propeller fold [Singulisphaera sp. GP187]